LANSYPLFNGEQERLSKSIETFPHAVVRRLTLRNRGYDVSSLRNIDFVDAALCADAAYEFNKDNYLSFGSVEEGFIISPAC